MKTLPSIDWSALEDAYGPATDLPDDLLGLLAATPRKRAAALDRLWARVCHQGSVYPASAAAVPHLVQLALSPRTRDRHLIVVLLTGIAVGDHTNFLDGALSSARFKTKPGRKTPQSVEAQCNRAVTTQAPALRSLLGDRDARVRGAAAFALAWLSDPSAASAKAIAARYGNEREEATRVSMLIALGHLHASAHRSTFERALAERGATSPVRVAAAIALAYVDGKKVSGAVRETLEAACVARRLLRTGQPWNGGDLAGQAAAMLATLPARKKGRTESIARLNVVGYLAGDRLAGELVGKVFTGRDPKSAASLTDVQRDLLATILRAGLVRFKGHVESSLRLRGLPPLRDLPKFVGVEPGIHRELRRR